MAKLKGPLFSIDARGKLGDSLIYSSNKGIKRASRHFKPQNPRTILQQDNRAILRYAVQSWQSLTDDQKESYNQSAKNLGLKMSGYNYYLQTYIEAYAVPPPPPGIVTDGLMGWWKLDENTGIYTYDDISNMRGQFYNTPIWVTGKSNYAIDFNADSKYATVPNAELSDWFKNSKSAITLECWIFLNTINRRHISMISMPYNTELVFGVEYVGGHWNTLGSYAAGLTGGWYYSDDLVFQAGQWYHIALVWNGSHRTHYINAQVDGTPQASTGTMAGQGANTTINFSENSAWSFNSIIDEIRFYNRALSQAELQQNYNVDV